MSKDSKEYLKHIQDECLYLTTVAADLSFEDFIKDETLKRAVIRSLEIIGEAVKKIPADLRAHYPNIQWKNMAGMRDRLIHDYMGVNYLIAWDVIKDKIPGLYSQIKAILIEE